MLEPWFDFDTFSLFDSTNADTPMLTKLSTCPTPILWRGVSDLPAKFRHVGKRILSNRARNRGVDMRTKTRMEPAGIWKWCPTWRSIAKAWRIDKLACTPMVVPRKKVLDHSGKILIKDLKSSTSCTEQSLHRLLIEPSDFMSPSLTIAARFKNLHHI